MTDVKFYAARDPVSLKYIQKGGRLSNTLSSTCLWGNKGHLKAAITNYKEAIKRWSYNSPPGPEYYVIFDIIEYKLDSGFFIDTYAGKL